MTVLVVFWVGVVLGYIAGFVWAAVVFYRAIAGRDQDIEDKQRHLELADSSIDQADSLKRRLRDQLHAKRRLREKPERLP